MHARSFNGVALASVLSTFFASTAFAGGGGHGSTVFHAGGGLRGGSHWRGEWGRDHSATRPGMPPIAGVIHERPGMRPYVSAYGHTDTAVRFGHGGVPDYGHVDTAPRYGAERRVGAIGGRQRSAGRAGFVGGRYGGYGYGGFGGGTYGTAGIYGDAGVYGGQGTYGQSGSYGQPGTYGGLGTTATQGIYGSGYGAAYRSETPLAVRYAEPPLGPSPYAPYSPGDRYAYAASEDVRPVPRVIDPYRGDRAGCACEARRQPVFYHYGIGTAY